MYESEKMRLYDVHDAKMLYCLTQYFLWNHRYHPFLSCKYQRGAGVKDDSHQCRMLTEEEYLQYYNYSKLRWDEKRQQVGADKYKEKDHCKWTDKKNFGITHFGIHPTKLKRGNIRMDTFHTMTYLQTILAIRCKIKFNQLTRILYSSVLCLPPPPRQAGQVTKTQLKSRP